MIKLEIQAFDNEPARVFPLSEARIVIGRNEESDIQIDSGVISGSHAEISIKSEDSISLTDLGSINGTYVNGEKITNALAKPGDQIKFGNVEARLSATLYPKKSTEADAPMREPAAVLRARQALASLENLRSGNTAPVANEAPAAPADTSPPTPSATAKEHAAPAATPPPASTPTAPLPDTSAIAELSEKLNEIDRQLKATREQESEVSQLREQLDQVSKKQEQDAAAIQKKEAVIEQLKKAEAEQQQALAEGKEQRDQAKQAQQKIEQLSLLTSQQETQLKELRAKLAAALKSTPEDQESIRQAEQKLAETTAQTESLLQRIDALEQLDSKQQDTNEKLAARIEELTVELTRASEENESLSRSAGKKNSDLAETITLLENELRERDADIHLLNEAAAGKAEAGTEADELRQQIDKLEQNALEQQEANNDLVSRYGSLEEELAQSNRQLAEASKHETTAVQLAETVEQLKSQILERDTELSRLSKAAAEGSDAAEELDLLNKQIAALEQSSSEQQTANGKLTSHIESLNGELARAQEQLAAACADNKSAELTETVSKLQSELEQRDAEVTTLKTELQNSTASAGEADARLHILQEEKSRMEQQLDTFARAHGDVEKAKATVDQLREEAENLEAQKAQQKVTGEEIEKELDELRQNAEKEKHSLDSALGDLKAELNDTRSELNAFRKNQVAAREALTEKTLAVQKQCDTAHAELSALIEQQIKAESRRSVAEKATAKADKQCTVLEVETDRLDRLLGGMRRKMKRRRKLLDELKTIKTRERELKQKLELGRELIKQAESHKAGFKQPFVAQPWDIDEANAERESALQEAAIIQREVAALKAALDESRSGNQSDSAAPQASSADAEEPGSTAQLVAQLRDMREDLTAQNRAEDDTALAS